MSDEPFVHPTAVVDEGAELGPRTKVWHFCHVMPGAVLGAGCNLGQNVFVSGTARLGENVKVQNNVSIYDGVTCEDDVFLGPSCVFTNVSTPRSAVNRRGQYEKTHVGRGATIGANATIVCGTCSVRQKAFSLRQSAACSPSAIRARSTMAKLPIGVGLVLEYSTMYRDTQSVSQSY